MSTTITRSTWINDTGTPTAPVGDGTQINNAVLQGDIYDPIDDVLAGNLLIGGTLGAEGFGTHLLSASGTGRNELFVRNPAAGNTNMARVGVQNDAAQPTGMITLDMASSTFTPTTSLLAGGGRLFCGGPLALETNATTGIRLWVNGSQRGLIDNTVGFLAENTYGFYTKNTGGTAIPMGALDASNDHFIGSDNASHVRDTYVRAGFEIIFRNQSTERARITSAGAFRVGNGTAGVPTVSFLGDTDAGLYYDAAVFGCPAITMGGMMHTAFKRTGSSEPQLEIYHGAFGTGARPGCSIRIGRNDSGGGAAGYLDLNDKNAVNRYLWVDASGNLRIGSSPPTEDGTTVSDTSGTVVGTQTSSRAAKDVLGRYDDIGGALRIVCETPIYRWRYKKDRGIQGEDFIGILTDESPLFGMDGGKVLNTANAIGLLIAAVQAQQLQIDSLRKAA